MIKIREVYSFTITIVVLSAVVFSTCGCKRNETVKQESSANEHGEKPIKIMPLGDSITQADSKHNSYRRNLWLKLKLGGYNIDIVGSQTKNHPRSAPPNPDFDLNHEGHWGWRTDHILDEIDQWAGVYQPDIVLMHLGHNDIFESESIQSTIKELGDNISILRSHNSKVVVLLAQLISTYPLSDSIRKLNAAIAELARSKSTVESPVIVVNQDDGFNAAVDTYDGVHPNESGEEKMAAKWYEAIVEILQKP